MPGTRAQGGVCKIEHWEPNSLRRRKPGAWVYPLLHAAEREHAKNSSEVASSGRLWSGVCLTAPTCCGMKSWRAMCKDCVVHQHRYCKLSVPIIKCISLVRRPVWALTCAW